VGPTAGLERCGRFPPPGFDPRTVKPVAKSLRVKILPQYKCSMSEYTRQYWYLSVLSRCIEIYTQYTYFADTLDLLPIYSAVLSIHKWNLDKTRRVP